MVLFTIAKRIGAWLTQGLQGAIRAHAVGGRSFLVAALLFSVTHAQTDEGTEGRLTPSPPTVDNLTAIASGRPTQTLDDLQLKADRTTVWTQDESRMIYLERNVLITSGSYGFQADRALVRIDDRASPPDLSAGYDATMDLENIRSVAGQAQIRTTAARLLVSVTTTGPVSVATDVLRPSDDPVAVPFVTQSLSRMAQRRLKETGDDPSLESQEAQPQTSPNSSGDEPRAQDTPLQISGAFQSEGVESPTPMIAWLSQPPSPSVEGATLPAQSPHPAPPPPTEAGQPPPSPHGTVSFHADRIVFQEGDDQEDTLVLNGHVGVTYQDHENPRSISMTAMNAVIFFSANAVDLMAQRDVDINSVRGVYLEDNVIVTDGQYTIRAPRVFYDLAHDQAVVLDAVLHTWNHQRRLPIYVRAKMLRQDAADRWSAHDAVLATSEFAVPHFAIAAKKITLRQRRDEDGLATYPYQAQDLSLKWGPLPVGYWPALAGEAGRVEDLPLQRVHGSYSRNNGPTVETTWNLFSLLGRTPPEGVELLGRADFQGDHGPATGLDLRYDQPQMWGLAHGYLVFDDHGDDEFADRRNVLFDGDTRGYALWRHRHYLLDDWQLSLEMAFDSDETFLEEFFRDEAELSKPYETSIYLKTQEEDWAFTFLAQYDLLDFTPQTTTLQAPGYTVEKLPELGYFRIGTSLLDNQLTWFTENRATVMRVRAGDDRPADRGFTPGASVQLFGQAHGVSFERALSDRGVPTDKRLRLDSRHELQAPSKLGILDLTPYVAGRVTAYDDDFAEFSGDGDKIRLWGSLGVRAHTHFSRVYNQAHAPWLDVNRLRHIIEPGVDLFWSGATLDRDDLPVYDQDVESIQDGLGFRFGLRNTLQTQRGGQGKWRNVDWLVLDTDVIVRGSDADSATRIARFFSYRPELSRGGNHLHSQLGWRVSEVLALSGDMTFNIDRERTAQWRVGTSLRHTPRLSSFVDYAEIDDLASRLLHYGFTYELTRKYDLRFKHVLDFGSDASRQFEVRLERRLPRWRLIALVRVDELDDEQTFGLVLIPEGFGSSRYRPSDASVFMP